MTKKIFYHLSTHGITHLVYGGYYVCNRAIGKIKVNHETGSIWCANCERTARKK